MHVENIAEPTSPLIEPNSMTCDDSHTDQVVGDRGTLLKRIDAELFARNPEIHELRAANKRLGEANEKFSLEALKNDDDIKLFPGLPKARVFLWVAELVSKKASWCHSLLTSNDHVLTVLMRLRLGLLYKDIAYRFGDPDSTISKAFRVWLAVLSKSLRNLIIWTD